MWKDLTNRDNIRWVSLGILGIVNLFWFVFMGNCYLYGDMSESVGEAAGTIPTTSQHTLLIVIFLRLFWFTGNAIFIWNLTMFIGITFSMWYLVITINKLGADKKWVLGLTLFFAFWPQYFWIVSFTSKDQLISIMFMLFTGIFINWTQKPKLKLQHFLIFGVTFIFLAMSKTVNFAIIIAVIILAFKFKKYFRQILITGISSFLIGFIVIGIMAQGLVNSNNPGKELQDKREAMDTTKTATSQTQTQSEIQPSPLNPLNYIYLPFSPNQQIAAAFDNPNSNIPAEDKTFFDYSSGDPSWYKRRHPILADFAGQAIAAAHQYSTSEFLPHYFSICGRNFGTCFMAAFAQQSGFFVPKFIQGPATDTPARPIMVSLSMIPETNKTEYLPTNYSQMPTAVSQRFCTETSGSAALTEEGYHSCFVQELGQERGDLLFQNVKQYIKQEVYDKQISPDFTKGLVHFWAHDAYIEGSNPLLAFFTTIFLDGFWLFWAVILIFVVAIQKRLQRLIPAIWIPISFYIIYLMYSPVAYERYVWPIFCIVPFLITAVFGVDNKKFTIGRAKKK